MRIEPIELLVDIELLQPEHQFLLDTPGIRRLRQVREARLQLLPLPGADLRHQRTYVTRDPDDGFATLADHLRQFASLAFARGHEIVQHGIQQGLGLTLQGIGIEDVAVAETVYRLAVERGVGLQLPS